MNYDDWPTELESFYESLALSEDRTSDILQMRELLSEGRKWRRVAGLLAAGAAVLLVTTIYFFSSKQNAVNPPQTIASQDNDSRRPATSESTTEPIPSDKQQQNRKSIPFEMVAVKVNHDGCPQCKKMGNVFAELQQDLEGKPILFLTFDISDSVRHEQSRLLSEALGISGVMENNLQTGMVVLIDPRGQLIEQLDGTSGREQLVNQIAMRLEKP